MEYPSLPQDSELNVIKGRLSVIKNYFVKNKKLFIPLAVIILFLIILFVGKNISPNVKKDLISDGWEKLVLDQKYTPLYILSPSEERKFGILSQEVFTLKTREKHDENFIQENLVTSKPVNITKISDTEYKVIPVGGLGIDETISMSIKDNEDYRWVFQTAPKFNIVGNLPKNEATNVPINTGIEVTFNNDNF